MVSNRRCTHWSNNDPSGWIVFNSFSRRYFVAAGTWRMLEEAAASGDSGLVVTTITRQPSDCVFSAVQTTLLVVPDPDTATKRSPSPIAGVIVSPTTNT